MGAFKYILKNEREIYKNKERKAALLLELTKQPAIVRIEKPTRLAKAKTLGYSAKQGIIVVRARVGKGSFRRNRPVHARRPSKTALILNYKPSKLKIAEERVKRVYKNMKPLGGYFLADNGKYKWYEIILADKNKLNK